MKKHDDSKREPLGPGAVNVVCHGCSYYFAVEVSGRRQATDCPQCMTFAGAPDPEGGLVVRLVCRGCAVAYVIDVSSEKGGYICPVCGAEPRKRERETLSKLVEVWRLRQTERTDADRKDDRSLVNLDEMDLDESLTVRVPKSIALAYHCIPIRFENDVLTVAMADRVQRGVLEDLAFVLRCAVQGAAAPRSAVERALQKCYGSDGPELPA